MENLIFSRGVNEYMKLRKFIKRSIIVILILFFAILIVRNLAIRFGPIVEEKIPKIAEVKKFVSEKIIEKNGFEIIKLATNYDSVFGDNEEICFVNRENDIDTEGNRLEKFYYTYIDEYGTIIKKDSRAEKYGADYTGYGGISHFGKFRFYDVTKKIYDENWIEIVSCDDTESFSDYATKIKINNKYGFINHDTGEIIEPQYDKVYALSDGVSIVYKKGLGYGYVSESGMIIAPCIYSWADTFHDGVAWTKWNGKYFLINKQGETLFSSEYKSVNSFSNGLAGIYNDRYYGYIDKNGNEVIPFEYDYAYDFSEGRAIVVRNNKYGVIDKSGNVIVEYIYDDIKSFSQGLAVVCYNGKFGIIDINGNKVVDCIYDNIESFMSDFTVVFRNGKYGCINKIGEEVIKCHYDAVWATPENNLFIVSLDNDISVVNSRTNKSISVNLQSKYRYGPIENGFYGIEIANPNYFNILEIREIFTSDSLPSEFYEKPLEYIKWYLTEESKYKILNDDFKEIAISDDITYTSIETMICIKKGEKYGIVDKNGKTMLPCMFDNIEIIDNIIIAKDEFGTYLVKKQEADNR